MPSSGAIQAALVLALVVCGSSEAWADDGPKPAMLLCDIPGAAAGYQITIKDGTAEIDSSAPGIKFGPTKLTPTESEYIYEYRYNGELMLKYALNRYTLKLFYLIKTFNTISGTVQCRWEERKI